MMVRIGVRVIATICGDAVAELRVLVVCRAMDERSVGRTIVFVAGRAVPVVASHCRQRYAEGDQYRQSEQAHEKAISRLEQCEWIYDSFCPVQLL
jgi:hypothetical protein